MPRLISARVQLANYATEKTLLVEIRTQDGKPYRTPQNSSEPYWNTLEPLITFQKTLILDLRLLVIPG